MKIYEQDGGETDVPCFTWRMYDRGELYWCEVCPDCGGERCAPDDQYKGPGTLCNGGVVWTELTDACLTLLGNLRMVVALAAAEQRGREGRP